MANVKKALQAEGNGESVSFTFRGTKLTVATGDDLSASALEAFENDKPVTFVKLALGPEQWAKVNAKGGLKVKDIHELVNALAEAQGSSEGE